MEFNLVIPKTKSELLVAMRTNKNYRFAAGCTDLLMELKKNAIEGLTVINLVQVNDQQLTGMKYSAKGLRMGAMSTAHHVGINNEIEKHFPVLKQAALNLASTQIRQVATIGGNICTASPSGDISCALVALNCNCEIINTSGDIRIVPIQKFFTGPRQTSLKKNEMLYGVIIPPNDKNTNDNFSGFVKIGTRQSMECSVVSLAYHIQTDKTGKILHAGIAIGSSAPTIKIATKAGDFLIGKTFKLLTEKEKQTFAEYVLTYAAPITDLRATAWYRKEVLFNISKSIFE